LIGIIKIKKHQEKVPTMNLQTILSHPEKKEIFEKMLTEKNNR
jgi:hypothetical protein